MTIIIHDQISVIMSRKKRDHAWGENGFEDWVSRKEPTNINITYIYLCKLNSIILNKNYLYYLIYIF